MYTVYMDKVRDTEKEREISRVAEKGKVNKRMKTDIDQRTLLVSLCTVTSEAFFFLVWNKMCHPQNTQTHKLNQRTTTEFRKLHSEERLPCTFMLVIFLFLNVSY